MTKILDCTFRDGGYYTNWCFDDHLVQTYLECCARAGVDLIEIGFYSLTPMTSDLLGA